MLDHTCDHLKHHVEEEMLPANVDKGMGVESPELHLVVPVQDDIFHLFVCLFFFNLFVPVQDERVINGEVIAVVVPTKRPPFFLDANVVVDEKSDLQESYAHDENWTVALFLLNPNVVSHLFSQG